MLLSFLVSTRSLSSSMSSILARLLSLLRFGSLSKSFERVDFLARVPDPLLLSMLCTPKTPEPPLSDELPMIALLTVAPSAKK